MGSTNTRLVLCLGGLLMAAACTVPNPAYSGTDGAALDGPTTADIALRDARKDSHQPDLRPRPDSLPWQCQKDIDCGDGLACTVDSCSPKKTCEHTLKAGSCLIGGACTADGTVNPKDICQACLASQSTSSWMPRPDGTACTPDALSCTKDSCSGGKCGHLLDGGACLINNHCYWAGDPNPTSPCEVCDPFSPYKWTPSATMICYQDQDGDGVGGNVTQTACSCSAGWSLKSGDCEDGNADVFPGQTAYFSEPYTSTFGMDSWDYNCNLLPEPKYVSIGYCYKSGSGCKWQAGWSVTTGSDPPLCGVTSPWITSCTMSSGGCTATATDLTQACR